MFTIKYVMTDGSEMLNGPFEMVSATFVDRDDNLVQRGACKVTAYRPECTTVTYGPIFRDSEPLEPIAFVYVMNDRGTTVAKYEL
jgi:hypothetical protein